MPSNQDDMFGLDLNSSVALDFLHMGAYQDILESIVVENASSGGCGTCGAHGIRGSHGGSSGHGGTRPWCHWWINTGFAKQVLNDD